MEGRGAEGQSIVTQLPELILATEVAAIILKILPVSTCGNPETLGNELLPKKDF